MIKNFHFLRRRADFDHSQFTDYWLNEHARIVMSIPHMRPLRYVQNHIVNKDEVCEAGARIDGIPESWRSSLPARLHSNPEWKKVVLPDERKFIDTSVTSNVPCQEEVIVDGAETPLKLILLGKEALDLGRPAGISRHVRNHPLADRQITLEGTEPEHVWAAVEELFFHEQGALDDLKSHFVEQIGQGTIVAMQVEPKVMYQADEWRLEG